LAAVANTAATRLHACVSAVSLGGDAMTLCNTFGRITVVLPMSWRSHASSSRCSLLQRLPERWCA